MDIGCTSVEPVGVLWDMFFPWMSTNLLSESMVMMGWDDWRLATLWKEMKIFKTMQIKADVNKIRKMQIK